MPAMKLYWSPASPYARKVRAVAHEKGLTDRIEEIVVDAFSDPAALVAANPLGKVPTLICEDGGALFDSPVICCYLDAHPEGRGAALCPSSGPERWSVLKTEALADGMMDLGLGLTLERRKPEAERSPTTAARWRGQLARCLDAMMPEIRQLPAQITIGHLAAACALGYLDFRHPDFTWREERAGLAAWYADIAGRPSLTATAPK
jgi:glutathione S-transferase